MVPLIIGSLYMAVLERLRSERFKNTLEKGPFLLVRFLWASKENEQYELRIDHWRKKVLDFINAKSS